MHQQSPIRWNETVLVYATIWSQVNFCNCTISTNIVHEFCFRWVVVVQHSNFTGLFNIQISLGCESTLILHHSNVLFEFSFHWVVQHIYDTCHWVVVNQFSLINLDDAIIFRPTVWNQVLVLRHFRKNVMFELSFHWVVDYFTGLFIDFSASCHWVVHQPFSEHCSNRKQHTSHKI